MDVLTLSKLSLYDSSVLTLRFFYVTLLLTTFGVSAATPQSHPIPLRCEDLVTRFRGENGSTYQLYVTQSPWLSSFDVRSYLNSTGFLHLYIITRDKNEKLATPLTGSEIFSEIIGYFGSENIRGIIGNWYWGTNLKRFQELVKASVPMDEAAKQTWTGRQAVKLGFTQAEFISVHKNADAISGARVLFTRTEDKLFVKDFSESDFESIDWFFDSE